MVRYEHADAALDQVADDALNVDHRQRVDARKELVQQHETRLRGKRARNLHAPALLPADYASDVHERLVLYKRLANCEGTEELDRLREELVDRFGPLPEHARALVESHRLRILDDGPGLNVDILSALGEPYVTSRPDSGGMGLGVFIAMNLLRRSGAGVTFANRPGGGTQVSVAWPRSVVARAP